jgi:MFS family permease
MSQLFTPKNAERKIFQLSIFQDGIWDMQIGGMIMLFSFYPVTRRLLGPGWNLILIFGLLALVLIIGARLKRTVSNPRMGLVKYGKSQKSRLLTMRLIIFGIFLVSSALAIALITQVYRGPSWGPNTPEWLQLLSMDIVFGLVVVAIFSLVSGVFQMWRPFIYGLLLGGSLVATGALTVYGGPEFNYPFAIAGGIILVIGLGLMLRFVRTYQIPPEEA